LQVYWRANADSSFRGIQVSEDKAFVTTFTMVIGVLVAVAVVFYFVASLVTEDTDTAERDERWQAKVEENIRPVGQVNVGSVPVASETTATAAAAAEPRSGEQVYNSFCMACHAAGVAGAPKTGDGAAWSARASKGIDGLLATATSGINAMPPMGTCADCSEQELRSSIEYILQQSGL
jgi:cytochrome c5